MPEKKLDNSGESLERPLRWPEELGYETPSAAAKNTSRNINTVQHGGSNDVLIKVLKVTGKVMLYMTLGIFIVVVKAMTDSTKDALKGNTNTKTKI